MLVATALSHCHLDGVFLFSLPAYTLIKNWMLLTLVLSALFAGTIYWVRGDIEYDIHHRSISPTAIAHGSALLGCLFAVKAWSSFLDRYLLLYGDNGVVVGASYTDVHVGLPALWLMIGLSIIAALAAWANLRVRTYRLPAVAIVLVGVGTFVLSGVIPGLFRQFFVKPLFAGYSSHCRRRPQDPRAAYLFRRTERRLRHH